LVCPNPKLEDTGTNQRGSSVFVKKSLSGTEHRFFLLIFRPHWSSVSSPSVASLPKSSCCTTALWVKSCGCFSAGSSARGVVPSLPDPWWCKGLVAGATRARPWNCGNHLAVPLFPFYHSSLSGVPVVISYLISYYLCSFRRSCRHRHSGARAHLINTARLKALSARGQASF
jgi:hypothetical protein